MQLSGCEDGTVRIWDIPAKRSLRRLTGHQSELILILQYSPSVLHDCACQVRRKAFPLSGAVQAVS